MLLIFIFSLLSCLTFFLRVDASKNFLIGVSQVAKLFGSFNVLSGGDIRFFLLEKVRRIKGLRRVKGLAILFVDGRRAYKRHNVPARPSNSFRPYGHHQRSRLVRAAIQSGFFHGEGVYRNHVGLSAS